MTFLHSGLQDFTVWDPEEGGPEEAGRTIRSGAAERG